MKVQQRGRISIDGRTVFLDISSLHGAVYQLIDTTPPSPRHRAAGK